MPSACPGREARVQLLPAQEHDSYWTSFFPAIAVLGVFVYAAFSAILDVRVEGMDLPRGVRSELEAAKADLGAAEAPEEVDAGTAAQIEGAIDESFVAGFRAAMVVCCGLALMSALAAALLVGDRRVQSASRDPHPSHYSGN